MEKHRVGSKSNGDIYKRFRACREKRNPAAGGGGSFTSKSQTTRPPPPPPKKKGILAAVAVTGPQRLQKSYKTFKAIKTMLKGLSVSLVSKLANLYLFEQNAAKDAKERNVVYDFLTCCVSVLVIINELSRHRVNVLLSFYFAGE
jgi:hypothetical protein